MANASSVSAARSDGIEVIAPMAAAPAPVNHRKRRRESCNRFDIVFSINVFSINFGSDAEVISLWLVLGLAARRREPDGRTPGPFLDHCRHIFRRFRVHPIRVVSAPSAGWV